MKLSTGGRFLSKSCQSKWPLNNRMMIHIRVFSVGVWLACLFQAVLSLPKDIVNTSTAGTLNGRQPYLCS